MRTMECVAPDSSRSATAASTRRTGRLHGGGSWGVAKMVGDVTQRESWLLVTFGTWVGWSILTCPEARRDTPVPPPAMALESTEWERNHCRFLGNIDRTMLA